MTEKDERREYLKRLMAFTCPIPQYEQTRKRLAEWYGGNDKKKGKNK